MPLSKQKLIKDIIKLANERLTKKQKQILEYLLDNSNLTASKVVIKLKSSLKCSLSCVWNNLRVLAKAGLISFGNKNPVLLTPIGAIISKKLKGSDRNGKR